MMQPRVIYGCRISTMITEGRVQFTLWNMAVNYNKQQKLQSQIDPQFLSNKIYLLEYVF